MFKYVLGWMAVVLSLAFATGCATSSPSPTYVRPVVNPVIVPVVRPWYYRPFYRPYRPIYRPYRHYRRPVYRHRHPHVRPRHHRARPVRHHRARPAHRSRPARPNRGGRRGDIVRADMYNAVGVSQLTAEVCYPEKQVTQALAYQHAMYELIIRIKDMMKAAREEKTEALRHERELQAVEMMKQLQKVSAAFKKSIKALQRSKTQCQPIAHPKVEEAVGLSNVGHHMHPGPVRPFKPQYRKPVYIPVPIPTPGPPVHTPVFVPEQRPQPFKYPEYTNPDMVQCKFKNTSNRDARVMVKITYHLHRTRMPGATPVKRVTRSYVTIKANSEKLAAFRIAQSAMGGSHEVVVLRGDVKYNCGFGRI